MSKPYKLFFISTCLVICLSQCCCPCSDEEENNSNNITELTKTQTDSLQQNEIKNKSLIEKENELTKRENELNEKDKSLNEKEKSLIDKDNELTMKEQQLNEKDKIVNDKKKSLIDKENELTMKDQQLNEKDKIINDKEKSLNLKEKSLNEKEKSLIDQENELTKRVQQLNEKDKIVNDKEKSLNEKDKIINDREKSLNLKEKSLIDKDKIINDKEKSLNLKEKSLIDKDNELTKKDKTINDKEQSLNLKEKSLIDKENELTMKDQQLNEKDKIINDKEKSLNEKQKQFEEITKRENEIKKKEKELNEKEIKTKEEKINKIIKTLDKKFLRKKFKQLENKTEKLARLRAAEMIQRNWLTHMIETIKIRITKILRNIVERRNERDIDDLRMALKTWEDNAGKITRESAKKRIAKFMAETYLISNARKNWRDLADKKYGESMWELQKRIKQYMLLNQLMNDVNDKVKENGVVALFKDNIKNKITEEKIENFQFKPSYKNFSNKFQKKNNCKNLIYNLENSTLTISSNNEVEKNNKTFDFNNIQDEYIEKFKDIKELILKNIIIQKLELNDFPNLQTLKIEECEIKDIQDLFFTDYTENKKTLELNDITLVPSEKYEDNGDTIDLTLSVFSKITLKNIKNLKTFDVSDSENLEQISLENVDCLEEINTNNCKNLKDIDGLKNIKKLKTLNISDCNEIENIVEKLPPEVENLYLNNLKFLKNDIFEKILENCKLKKIYLNNCENLTKICLPIGEKKENTNIDKLEYIDLKYCTNLEQISLENVSNLEIDLEYCINLEQISLKDVSNLGINLKYCENLKQISLENVNNLKINLVYFTKTKKFCFKKVENLKNLTINCSSFSTEELEDLKKSISETNKNISIEEDERKITINTISEEKLQNFKKK